MLCWADVSQNSIAVKGAPADPALCPYASTDPLPTPSSGGLGEAAGLDLTFACFDLVCIRMAGAALIGESLPKNKGPSHPPYTALGPHPSSLASPWSPLGL